MAAAYSVTNAHTRVKNYVLIIMIRSRGGKCNSPSRSLGPRTSAKNRLTLTLTLHTFCCIGNQIDDVIISLVVARVKFFT